MAIKSLDQYRRLLKLVREGKLSQKKLDEYLKKSPPVHSLPERLTWPKKKR